MSHEYRQIEWDAPSEDDCRQLVRLAIREDLDRLYDWTTVALVPEAAQGRAVVRARRAGIVAGLPAAKVLLDEFDPAFAWTPTLAEGDRVEPQGAIATLTGSARNLLTAERTLLNMLGRLSGIATLTRAYVDAAAGAAARIFDTRKTTPGWRRLEKYAVRVGGGWNHRLGLYDGVLIKDNHLALGATSDEARYSPAEAIDRCRQVIASLSPPGAKPKVLVEVEVDSLAQLDLVLAKGPDVVLLDNMPLEELRLAVEKRNAAFAGVQLEASGGVNLDSVAAIAATGVDRISVGALTHSAPWLDVGLDWE
ncbi:MAG: carboxylating nicotinate-nucleotide diphosphorylase [Planctomycetia bacterium]|nr:carboxylating nicotinate-nucleotide diphosphorylase [Planctomycetia bacterium]